MNSNLSTLNLLFSENMPTPEQYRLAMEHLISYGSYFVRIEDGVATVLPPEEWPYGEWVVSNHISGEL